MCNPMKHNDNKTLLYLACAHIGLIPNNSVLASISFVALCICWLFRFRANWENIKPLHKVPLLLSLYLFVAYECTSLFWSNEFTIGIENVISMRHCFLPVLLWPVMNQFMEKRRGKKELLKKKKKSQNYGRPYQTQWSFNEHS